MTELSEAEKTAILGQNYRPPDPSAPKPDIPVPLFRRIWAAPRGTSARR